MTLLLLLWHIAAALTFDADRVQQVRSWPLEPGYVYSLEHATATSGERYCLSVLEEVGPRVRALALVLGDGDWRGEHFDSTVVGARGAAYSVVVWRCRPGDAPGSVVVTLDIRKTRLGKERAP